MKSYRKFYGPAMMVLCIIAIVLSVILTLHSLSMVGLVGCSSGSSCDQVTGSRWSMVLGFLPVSAVSLGLYLAALLCIVYLMFEDDGTVRKILALLSSAISAGSLWFIGIQSLVLKAFCPYCMSAHICGIAMSLTAAAWLLKDPGITRRDLGIFSGTGAALAVAFAVFQILTMPSYRSFTGRSQAALPIPEASDAPHIGPEDAPHQIALLYDYQCPHCRVVHGLLEDVVERFGSQVTFVLCPSPLSPECNQYIPAGQDRFPGSCTMARLALSLWNGDPEDFTEYDGWMMEEMRSTEECIAKAREIRPDVSEYEEWTRIYLAQTLELFARTTMNGQGGIPRLVYGDSWVIPEVDDADGLVRIIEDLTGLSASE